MTALFQLPALGGDERESPRGIPFSSTLLRLIR